LNQRRLRQNHRRRHWDGLSLLVVLAVLHRVGQREVTLGRLLLKLLVTLGIRSRALDNILGQFDVKLLTALNPGLWNLALEDVLFELKVSLVLQQILLSSKLHEVGLRLLFLLLLLTMVQLLYFVNLLQALGH